MSLGSRYPLLLAALMAFALASCQVSRNSANGIVVAPPNVPGNGDIYGGGGRARLLALLAVQDLVEAYRFLQQRSDLTSDLCSPVCAPGLDATVCDDLTKSTAEQRAIAKQFVLSAAEKSLEILSKDDADLIVIAKSLPLVRGEKVNGRTQVGPEGAIELSGPWLETSPSLNQIDRLIGHELHHKVLFGAGATATYLNDEDNAPAFGASYGAEHLLTLAGACLAGFAEKHNYQALQLSFLNRGSGVVEDVRWRRGTNELVRLPARGVAVAAMTVKQSAQGALAVARLGDVCVADATDFFACPSPTIRDAFFYRGTRYFLDASGRVMDAQGAVLYENPRAISFGTTDTHLYLLTSDGSVYIGTTLDFRGGDLRLLQGISLPSASRLVMGLGL